MRRINPRCFLCGSDARLVVYYADPDRWKCAVCAGQRYEGETRSRQPQPANEMEDTKCAS